ncbi:hypothetical protein MB901379_00813 [Mycobacterium basiliense]|uniref:Uncharacterized protein n=1 Tax=Mycobacterium basiliense TaxID=2094119 RepID=A0A447G9X0_9MYCO|nr:hypothetical protein [Mycobacterium basiliense]VDM87277.1 hypothetical protein MB901379_00813 [Mycobacterium basiliense]
MNQVIRDGCSWPVGTAADVAWINEATSIGLTITSAIPPTFDAYATIVLPNHREEQRRRDRALLALLDGQSPGQRWWLGYLDTGSSDVVFPDAPRVRLYADWPYVLVQAGPQQAASWRQTNVESSGSKQLPDLMFPVDRTWLASTLWDDDWTCVGGPFALMEGVPNHPDLAEHTRPVGIHQDATPPGHQAR